VKVREAIELIEGGGRLGAGSHARQPSAVQASQEARAVAGKPSHDLAPGTLKAARKH